jgi:hypothetical protein
LAAVFWIAAASPPAHALELVRDGSFEVGDLPAWTVSENYSYFRRQNEQLQCRASTTGCPFFAASGNRYAQFGRAHPEDLIYCPCTSIGSATVSQTIRIPVGTATLKFAAAWRDGEGASSIQAKLDGTVLYSTTRLDPADFYQDKTVDVSAFADGANHVLAFNYSASGAYDMGYTDAWALDKVSLDVPDVDADGVADGDDNCPAVANPAQANADGDAQGDVCDPDDDNDGAADDSDSCPLVAGPPANGGCPPPPDSDGDGVADVADACPTTAGASDNGCPPDPPPPEVPPTPDVARTLTLSYKRGAFRGSLSPEGACAVQEKVSVFRKKPGRDPKVGSDKTNDRGGYLVGAPDTEGTYYAKANASERPEVAHCLAARSKKLKLD